MSLKDTILPVYKSSKSQGRQLIRDWRRTKTPAGVTALMPGNFIFTTYLAVTDKLYDYNPLVMIIRADKKYVFGINVNWLNRLEKTKLLKYLADHRAHEKSRLQVQALIRGIRRFRFTKKAYRLYHRKAFAKPRVFLLNTTDFYEGLMHDLLDETKNARG